MPHSFPTRRSSGLGLGCSIDCRGRGRGAAPLRARRCRSSPAPAGTRGHWQNSTRRDLPLHGPRSKPLGTPCAIHTYESSALRIFTVASYTDTLGLMMPPLPSYDEVRQIVATRSATVHDDSLDYPGHPNIRYNP